VHVEDEHAAGIERGRPQARLLALAVSLLTLILSISLFTGFDRGTADMQFLENNVWIETFRINYFLGVDGFSVPLILLTTFFGVLVVIAGWDVIRSRVHQYLASFLVMEGLMVGVFSALWINVLIGLFGIAAFGTIASIRQARRAPQATRTASIRI
jgi:NADH-quinone oxidoreductase subunit M